MREYAIIFERTRSGYSAYVPDLPGLIAAGGSFEEKEQLMREALEFHLSGMLEDGDSIPEATTRVGMVRTNVVETWPQRLAKTA